MAGFMSFLSPLLMKWPLPFTKSNFLSYLKRIKARFPVNLSNKKEQAFACSSQPGL